MQGWLARAQSGDQSKPESWVCDLLWGGNAYADKAFRTPGLEGRLLSLPAGQSNRGGDIHYITVCGHGVYSKFLLLDVSGHGTAAARWSGYLHEPLGRLMEEQDNVAILDELNSIMLRKGSASPGRFATAIATTYNNHTQRWIYAYAGHPYMLIRRDGAWQELSGAGERTVPVGIIDDTEYYQSAVTLETNDYVLMFTDGAFEMRRPDGQRLSLPGLIDLMNRLEASDVKELFTRLIARLVAINGQEEFNDDLTLVLLHHAGPVASPANIQ